MPFQRHRVGTRWDEPTFSLNFSGAWASSSGSRSEALAEQQTGDGGVGPGTRLVQDNRTILPLDRVNETSSTTSTQQGGGE
jgi:hypothetical protein